MDGGCRSSYMGEAVLSAMHALLRRTPHCMQAMWLGRLRLLVRGPENNLRREARATVGTNSLLGFGDSAQPTFLRLSAEEFLRKSVQRDQAASTLTDAEIDSLVQQRTDAKKAKNFKESDRIRDELKANGVILEDGPQGTTWRRS